MILVLQGQIELSTADGAFTVSPGDFYLLEDTSGSGHGVVVLGSEDYVAAVVTLPL